jgi:hypothetical protein
MKEESECCTRCMFTCCGCRALRPLDVKVVVDDVEKMRISKPFKCGGWIGCPYEMTLRDGETGAEIGHVKENFSSYCSKCFEGCCCCSSYHNVSTVSRNFMEQSNIGTTLNTIISRYLTYIYLIFEFTLLFEFLGV